MFTHINPYLYVSSIALKIIIRRCALLGNTLKQWGPNRDGGGGQFFALQNPDKKSASHMWGKNFAICKKIQFFVPHPQAKILSAYQKVSYDFFQNL